ncbi:MAG: hypothetical protein U1F43_31800 [Myxococcota bacterium]
MPKPTSRPAIATPPRPRIGSPRRRGDEADDDAKGADEAEQEPQAEGAIGERRAHVAGEQASPMPAMRTSRERGAAAAAEVR